MILYDVPNVVTDETKAMEKAMDYLLEMGHREIAVIEGTPGLDSTRLRHVGWRNAMLKRGLNPDQVQVETANYRYSSGYEAAKRILNQEKIPTAILCFNDEMAFAAKAAAGELGLQVPEDVSLVGFDNWNMSAYGNSDEIREGQIQMLTADMKKEYDAGNYVLCGGDFNHDLKAAEDDSAERESWAYPFPRAELPDHFSFCIDQLSDEERASLWDSARNADMEYIPGETYTVTLDGFIVSDNIECLKYENINTGYSYSDHDPVYVQFKLK